MVTVKKRNVEKVISDSDLNKYLKDGFEELKKEKEDDGSQSNGTNQSSDKSLEEMKVPELKEVAKSLGITGYSNLTQAELIKVITDHNNGN